MANLFDHNMKDKVLQELMKIDASKAHEFLELLPHIKESTFNKGDSFIQENKLVNKVGFVLKGNLISINHFNEKEVVNNFYIESQWVGNLSGYEGNLNSSTLLCTSKSTLIWIRAESLKEFFSAKPGLKIFEKHMIAKVINYAHNQLIKFKSLPPLRRYQLLMEERPEVIQQFSNYYIASFLGVSPETLSRLKKRQ